MSIIALLLLLIILSDVDNELSKYKKRQGTRHNK